MKEKLLIAFIFIFYGCSDSLYYEFEPENKELVKSSIVKSTISDDYPLFYSLFKAQFYTFTEEQKSQLNEALLKIMEDPVGRNLILELQYFSAKGTYIDIEIDPDLGPDAMYNRNMRRITLKASNSITLDVLLFEELFHVFQDNNIPKNLNSEIEAQYATYEYSVRHMRPLIYDESRNLAFLYICIYRDSDYSIESNLWCYEMAVTAVRRSSSSYESFVYFDSRKCREFASLKKLTYGLDLPKTY